MKAIFQAMILSVLFVAVAVTTSVKAEAADNVLLGLSLYKHDTKTEGPTIGTVDGSTTYYDIKLGQVSDWLYLGGIYSMTNATSNGGTAVKRSALGATAGYHNKGFLLDFSYFFTAKIDEGTTVMTKGTGLGVDFGYNQMISQSVFLGLQMSYRSFTYKEVEASGATTTQENKISSELYPMLNIGVAF